MSTTALTVVTVAILSGGLSTALAAALYRRRLAAASMFAAAEFAVLHITLVMSAWKEAAEEVPYPGASSLPTAVYDAPAWAAVVFLITGTVLAVIQWRHRKAAEKALAKALMDYFGLNEDTKPEKSEED